MDMIGAIAGMVGSIFESSSAVNIKKYDMRMQTEMLESQSKLNASTELNQRTDYMLQYMNGTRTIQIVIMVVAVLLVGFIMYLMTKRDNNGNN